MSSNFEMFVIILCYLIAVLPYSEQKAPVLTAAGDGQLHIYALPVGQGDGTVIQCPNGDITIVDLGSSTRVQSIYTVPEHNPRKRIKRDDVYMTDDELKTFLGDTTVKYVFITHADTDHYNLFINIDPRHLATVSEAYVGCEASDYSDAMQNWFRNYFKAPKKVHYNPKLNTVVSICSCSTLPVNVKVVAINTDTLNKPGCSNSNSMALRLEYGTFSLFLPGDLEDYNSFTYSDTGSITSSVLDDKGRPISGKPGVLKTVSDRGKIQSTVYRLAHHGAWPNANKPFFLKAIQPTYVFSSSQLPGTPGTYNHPNCGLYDSMILLPSIIKYSTAPPQKNYFCGQKVDGYKEVRMKEDDNKYGIFTTAAADDTGHLINYFIQIDSDGKKRLAITPKLWR